MPEPWDPRSKQAEFEAVALEHFNTLYSTALRLTRNASEAQDLVQETLLKAYRFFDRFEPGTNVKAWLFTILRNTYINTYRKTVRQHEQVDFDRIEPFYADPANDAEWLDQESLEHVLHHVVQDDVKRALEPRICDPRIQPPGSGRTSNLGGDASRTRPTCRPRGPWRGALVGRDER